MTIASLAAVVLAGVLIGATGIGGVLVVPALIELGGVAAQKAIAATSLAFGFPGVAALWFLRREREHLKSVLAIVLGAVPGAAFGAMLVHSVDTRIVLALVTATIYFAGFRAVFGQTPAAERRHLQAASGTRLAGMGLLVGIGSALTGTGGPVLLIPLLMLTHQPLRLAIVLGQAIQLPIALAAFAAHSMAGGLDWMLIITLGVVLFIAALVGQRLAYRVPIERLRTALAIFLILTGLWFTCTLFF